MKEKKQNDIGRKVSKEAFADQNSVTSRTVTNWLAMGMPHLKVSPRKVLIEPEKADQWLRDRFGVNQRVPKP